MKQIIRNPLTDWFTFLRKSKILEFKYKSKFLKIGYMSSIKNCQFGIYNTIYSNVYLNEVQLGDFSYISDNTNISRTIIGKFCSIGPDCKIGLGEHPSSTFVSTHPIFFSNSNQAQISFANKSFFNEFENITIGNDVWIGSNVLVMDGVNIGDGAIIAAGAIVTKDIPAYAIVGGVPAKLIKYRFEKDEIRKLLERKWWDMDIDYLKKNFIKFHDIKVFLKEK